MGASLGNRHFTCCNALKMMDSQSCPVVSQANPITCLAIKIASEPISTNRFHYTISYPYEISTKDTKNRHTFILIPNTNNISSSLLIFLSNPFSDHVTTCLSRNCACSTPCHSTLDRYGMDDFCRVPWEELNS